CANHASAWDPLLICLALPRSMPIRIMAKKELMEIPFIGWIIKKLGAFGVDRGHSDLNAVKTAIKAVRDGESLLVFPEGTRVEH
ncbi:MAG: 1-acyl-sn-glycerol-3-phosphate acyltransferase, partial [Oscillospiraceae bacterium]|nr:1-acyl-sn-glycerol-3-phosphate acyltransferase [Oscillospiraceae bacterium]